MLQPCQPGQCRYRLSLPCTRHLSRHKGVCALVLARSSPRACATWAQPHWGLASAGPAAVDGEASGRSAVSAILAAGLRVTCTASGHHMAARRSTCQHLCIKACPTFHLTGQALW